MATPFLCYAVYFEKDLSVGVNDPQEVYKLQAFLQNQGVYSGKMNGVFGGDVFTAVKLFQINNRINPTGYFGPQTREKANYFHEKNDSPEVSVPAPSASAGMMSLLNIDENMIEGNLAAKLLARNEFFGAKLLLMAIVLLLIIFKIWSKRRELARAWILSLNPELKKGNLRISGKLIGKIVPFYLSYSKFNSKKEKTGRRKDPLVLKLDIHRVKVKKYEEKIADIAAITKNANIDLADSPKKIKLLAKIKKENEEMRNIDQRLNIILDKENDLARKMALIEKEARAKIAILINETGVGRVEKNIREMIEKEEADRKEILDLRSDIENSVALARERFTKNGDRNLADILPYLVSLEKEMQDLFELFQTGGVGFKETKIDLLKKRDEVDMLLRIANEPPKAEQENQAGNRENQAVEPNYYEILMVDSKASQEEIEKAWRKLSHQYASDKFEKYADLPEWVKKEAENKHKLINKAHDILRDPVIRKNYDNQYS